MTTLARHWGNALYSAGVVTGLALNWIAVDALVLGGGTLGGSGLGLTAGFAVWAAVAWIARYR